MKKLTRVALPLALLVAGALSVACASSTGQRGGVSSAASPVDRPHPMDTPTPAPVPQVTPTPEPTQTPLDDCSAAGIEPTRDVPENLSPEAATMRRQILELAVLCDYEGLEDLARQGREYFTFTFGGTRSAAKYWRDLERAWRAGDPAGEPVMTKLVVALGIDFVGSDQPSGRILVWPSASQKNPTDADWQAVVDAGLHTQEEVDFMREGGSGYLGWRVEITDDGDWIAFVAGD